MRPSRPWTVTLLTLILVVAGCTEQVEDMSADAAPTDASARDGMTDTPGTDVRPADSGDRDADASASDTVVDGASSDADGADASEADAGDGERLNILFIAVDDLRPQLGCYGDPEPITPNIDDLAAQGTRFNRHYVSYPLCSPSRAALMTGIRLAQKRMPDGSKGTFDQQIGLQDTLPATLHNAGYYTAAYGKLYHGGVPDNDQGAWDVPGEQWIDDIKDWSPEIQSKQVAWGGRQEQFDEMTKKEAGPGALVWVSVDGPDNLLNDGKVADKTIDLLRKRPTDKPFFIVAGFSRPHLPWVAPKKYFDLYPADAGQLAPIPEGEPRELRSTDRHCGDDPPRCQWNEDMSDEQAQKLVRGYMASASYVDAQVGKILTELETLGLQDNTIVVLWGDHGYHLTDHGLWRKNTPYHVSLRSPLIVRVPNTTPGQVVEHVVETVDLYPTLLELTGVAIPKGVELQGTSRVPLLDDPSPTGGTAFTSARDTFGLINGRYRFTMSKDGGDYQLYDLNKDVGEWTDLSDRSEHQDRVKKFESRVRKAWKLK